MIARRQKKNLKLIRRFIVVLGLLGGCCQLFLVKGVEQWPSVFMAVAGALVLCFLFSRPFFGRHPLSSMILAGFGATHFLLPIVCMTLVWRPITYKMVMPNEIFGYALVTFLVLVFCHWFYAKNALLASLQDKLRKTLLIPAGVMTVPTPAQSWLMGAMGIAAMFVSVSTTTEMGGASKVLAALLPFSFAPFLLLVGPLFGGAPRLSKSTSVILVAFVAVMFFIAMASSRRAFVVIGFANAAMVFFLGVCCGVFGFPRIRNPVKWLSYGTVLLLLCFPISRAFKAAQIATTHAGDMSLTERFDKFITVFMNPELIAKKEATLALQSRRYTLWDEEYSGLEFFDRVINLRYHDNYMPLVVQMDEKSLKTVAGFDIDRAWSTLPDPILKMLGVRVNKTEAMSSSVGDLIWAIRYNSPWDLGKFKAGSLFANSYAYVGYAFPLLIGALAIPLFWLADTMMYRRVTSRGAAPILSFVVGLSLFWIFTTFGSATNRESPSPLINQATRGYVQPIILYVIVYQFTAFVTRPFADSLPRVRRRRGPVATSVLEEP